MFGDLRRNAPIHLTLAVLRTSTRTWLNGQGIRTPANTPVGMRQRVECTRTSRLITFSQNIHPRRGINCGTSV